MEAILKKLSKKDDRIAYLSNTKKKSLKNKVAFAESKSQLDSLNKSSQSTALGSGDMLSPISKLESFRRQKAHEAIRPNDDIP